MLLPLRSDISSDNKSTLMHNNENKQIKVLEYQDYNVFEKSEDPPPPYSTVVHIDAKLASFLSRLNLQELVGLFAKEDLSLEDLMKLSYENLKEIGVEKFKHRKLIAEEIEKIRTPLKVVLSSSGGTAVHQRGMLGQYDYDVNMGHYVQTNTERDSEHHWAVYMYPDSDHTWWVGPCPGAKAGWLHNPTPSVTLPEFLAENDWQCWVDSDKRWAVDPFLTIFPGSLSDLSAGYRVTASGEAARRWPAAFGLFTRTQRWWNGRPVFENNKGWFLHHGQSVGWMIGSKMGKHELMGSRWSHHCPASENHWKYFDFDASKFRPASVSVAVLNFNYQQNEKSVFNRWIYNKSYTIGQFQKKSDGVNNLSSKKF